MWKPVVESTQTPELDEEVDDVIASCVYFVVRGRNAWHGTWTSVYFNAAAFHPDLESAKTYVENGRERGSTWTIWQLPALAICGSSHAVLVTEVNTAQPLSTGPREPVDCTTIQAVARSFAGKNVYLFLADAARIEYSAPSAYSRYNSRSTGGLVPLAWTERQHDRTDAGVKESVATISRFLGL